MKILCLIIGLLTLSPAIYAENLILNGDFSQVTTNQMPEKWHLQSWGPPLGKISLTQPTDPQDMRAIRIENQNPEQQTFLAQSIKLESNQDYRLSFYIRAQEINGTEPYHGGMIYLLDSGNTLFSIGNSLYRHATGSFDWHKVEYLFKTPILQNNTCSMVLALRQASGVVMLAELKLEKIELVEKAAYEINLYPVDFQNKSYALCQDFPAALLLKMTIDPKLIPNQFLQLILDLPIGIDYIGSATLLPNRNQEQKLVFEQDAWKKQPIVRDGEDYARYHITFNSGFVEKLATKHAWENYNRIYLRANQPYNRKIRAYWRLHSEKMDFPEDFIELSILPALQFPEKACSKFQLCIARLWNMNAPENTSEMYVKLWTSLQQRPWTSDPYFINAFPPEQKKLLYDSFYYCQHVASGRSMPWFGPLYNAVSQNRFDGKLPPAAGVDGTPLPNSLSPWYMIEDPEQLIWKTLAEEYAQSIRKNPHIKAIALDYEPGAMTHCFSNESRFRFHQFANLHEIPSTAEILAKHKNTWLQFRIHQHQLILEKISTMIRNLLPEVQFWLISDPLQTGVQRVSEWCGVDVKAADPIVDIHQHMPYITGIPFFEQVKLNIEELKKPFFPFIDPSENMAMYYLRYTPEKVMQNIVAMAALGGYGIGFWPNDVFDGSYLHSITHSYRAIAEAEPFYFAEDKSTPEFHFSCKNVIPLKAYDDQGSETFFSFPQLEKQIRVFCHELDGNYLLTILNYNECDPVFIKLSLPDVTAPFYEMYDLLGQRPYSHMDRAFGKAEIQEGFLVEIAANGSMMLRLRRVEHAAKAPADSIAQADIQLDLRLFLAQYEAKNKVQTFTDGDCAVYWEVLKDKQAVLYLQHGTGRIGISVFEGGDVVSWQTEGRGQVDHLYHNNRGFLGRISLNSPRQNQGTYPFVIERIACTGQTPFVSLHYQIPDFQNASAQQNPLQDLLIAKRLELKDNGKSFRLSYEFSNPTKQEQTFSFRINNFPKVGSAFTGARSLNLITSIHMGTLSFQPGTTKSDRLFLINDEAAPELLQNFLFSRMKVESCIPDAFRIVAGDKIKKQLTIVPEQQFAGFYSWSNSAEGYTVEPISNMITLKPGQKLSWNCEYHLD